MRAHRRLWPEGEPGREAAAAGLTASIVIMGERSVRSVLRNLVGLAGSRAGRGGPGRGEAWKLRQGVSDSLIVVARCYPLPCPARSHP